MTAQEIYRAATRSRPIDIQALDPVDIFAAIIGSRKAAESLAAAPWDRLLEMPVREAMRELAILPHVGPGIAAKVILVPFAAIYMAQKRRESGGDDEA